MDKATKSYQQTSNKLRHDPHERFQSDWYRHYMAMFAEELRSE